MRKTATAVVLALVALFSILASQASACNGANLKPTRQSTAKARAAVTCLLNQQRRHHHLQSVHGNPALLTAAQTHTNAMVSQNFFSHEGDGTPASRAANAGYVAGASAWGVGEALEWGIKKGATPRAIVRGWMRSPEHRAIVLTRRFREVGVGVADGSPMGADQGAETFTALFGFRTGG
jgi:Uncharacterized protein with SCP/PR1 domains